MTSESMLGIVHKKYEKLLNNSNIVVTKVPQARLWLAFNCGRGSLLSYSLPSSSSVNLICKENTTRHRPPLSKARFSLLRLSLNARFLFQNTAIHNYSKFTRSHLGKRATYTTFFESFYSITKRHLATTKTTFH